MNQTYDSANSSINSSRIPAIYNKIHWDAVAALAEFADKPDGLDVFDYGCGKYDTAADVIEEQGGIWSGFDPFNRSEAYNAESLEHSRGGTLTAVVCSNVLNVIDSESAIQDVVNAVLELASINRCPFFFSVWEGDGSGLGRQTSLTSWQRNERARAYLRFFPDGTKCTNKVITNCDFCLR